MRMRGAGTEPSMIEASCAERVFSLARSRWQFGRKQRRSGNERRSESALSLSHRGADSSDSRKLMDRIDQLEKRQRLLDPDERLAPVAGPLHDADDWNAGGF